MSKRFKSLDDGNLFEIIIQKITTTKRKLNKNIKRNNCHLQSDISNNFNNILFEAVRASCVFDYLETI